MVFGRHEPIYTPSTRPDPIFAQAAWSFCLTARSPAGCGFLPSPIIALRQAGAAAVRVTGHLGKQREMEPSGCGSPFPANYCVLRGVPDLAQFAHGLGLFGVTALLAVSQEC
jgi:hypothetical protein